MIAQQERKIVPILKDTTKIQPGETIPLSPGQDIGYWLGQWKNDPLSEFNLIRHQHGLTLPDNPLVGKLLNGYTRSLASDTKSQVEVIQRMDPRALILIVDAAYNFGSTLRDLRSLQSLRPYELDQYREHVIKEGKPQIAETEVLFISGRDRSSILLGRSEIAGEVTLVTRAIGGNPTHPFLPEAA